MAASPASTGSGGPGAAKPTGLNLAADLLRELPTRTLGEILADENTARVRGYAGRIDIVSEAGDGLGFAEYLGDLLAALETTYEATLLSGEGLGTLLDDHDGHQVKALQTLALALSGWFAFTYTEHTEIVRTTEVDGWTLGVQVFHCLALVLVLVHDWQFAHIRTSDRTSYYDLPETVFMRLASDERPFSAFTLSDTIFAVKTLARQWGELVYSPVLAELVGRLHLQVSWLVVSSGPATIYDMPKHRTPLEDADSGDFRVSDSTVAWFASTFADMMAGIWLMDYWTTMPLGELLCVELFRPDIRAQYKPMPGRPAMGIPQHWTPGMIATNLEAFFAGGAENPTFVRFCQIMAEGFVPADAEQFMQLFQEVYMHKLMMPGSMFEDYRTTMVHRSERDVYVAETSDASANVRLNRLSGEHLAAIIAETEVDPNTLTERATAMADYMRAILYAQHLEATFQFQISEFICWFGMARTHRELLKSSPYPSLVQRFRGLDVCFGTYALACESTEQALYLFLYLCWQYTDGNLHGRFDIKRMLAGLFGPLPRLAPAPPDQRARAAPTGGARRPQGPARASTSDSDDLGGVFNAALGHRVPEVLSDSEQDSEPGSEWQTQVEDGGRDWRIGPRTDADMAMMGIDEHIMARVAAAAEEDMDMVQALRAELGLR